MRSTTISGAALALLSTAQAGVISPRQGSFSFECNGQEFPETSECEKVFSQFFPDSTATFNKPPGNTANVLTFNLGDESNCQIDIIFYDAGYTVTANQVSNSYDGVASTCFPSGTGGRAVEVGGRFEVAIRNNPDYDPPNKKREVKLVPQGVKPEKERGAARIETMSHAKRADGDTEFTYGVHTTYAKPGNFKHNIGNGLPGGSTWEWTQEKSVTDSLSLSMSVSAGIEGILSASLNTEISTSTTTTSGQATTININCKDNEFGQVYFQAYAETWMGVLKPSGDPLTVTKPMTNSDGTTAGYYAYDCIPT